MLHEGGVDHKEGEKGDKKPRADLQLERGI